jgi:hypothetical protein
MSTPWLTSTSAFYQGVDAGVYKMVVFDEDQLRYGGTISHAHIESRSMFLGVLEED